MKALALAVLCFFLPAAVRAADSAPQLVYEAGEPAPSSYIKLGWKFEDQLSVGYWYSAEQVVKIDQRINYLETRAAKECVDAQVSAIKLGGIPWLSIAIGIVGGAVIGYVAAKKLK